MRETTSRHPAAALLLFGKPGDARLRYRTMETGATLPLPCRSAAARDTIVTKGTRLSGQADPLAGNWPVGTWLVARRHEPEEIGDDRTA